MKLPWSKAALVWLAMGAAVNPGLSQTRQFQFEQFPARVYRGKIRIPKGVHKTKDGEWMSEIWKTVDAPKVNFAGEDDLAIFSCGPGCRYHELTNLRTGADNRHIAMFDGAEPPPTTKDGHPYLTTLYYRPNSRLLIAEYHLGFDDPKKAESCRQRYFVLEDGKLRAISKTLSFCTEDHEE